MFFGYFLKYFSRTIKILEKSKDLQIDHQAYFLMLPMLLWRNKIYCSTYTPPQMHKGRHGNMKIEYEI